MSLLDCARVCLGCFSPTFEAARLADLCIRIGGPFADLVGDALSACVWSRSTAHFPLSVAGTPFYLREMVPSSPV